MTASTGGARPKYKPSSSPPVIAQPTQEYKRYVRPANKPRDTIPSSSNIPRPVPSPDKKSVPPRNGGEEGRGRKEEGRGREGAERGRGEAERGGGEAQVVLRRDVDPNSRLR